MFHLHILHLSLSSFIFTIQWKCRLCSSQAKADILSRWCWFHQQDSDDEETAVGLTLNLDQGPQDHNSFQPYIPEDFANFEIYNATLDGQDGFVSSRSDLRGSRCGGGGGGGEREVPRSPTASSCTSGYFSHSASNATLSDMPFSASESSDHLSCTTRDPPEPLSCPAGRGCTQTKSASAGSDTQQPLDSGGGVQGLLMHPTTLPVSIPNCTDEQQTFPLPHNSVLSTSQEFTDFKGADDIIAEGDITHLTEGWQQEALDLPTRQQKKNHIEEICDTCNAPTPICKCQNSKDSDSVAVLSLNTNLVSAPIGAMELPALALLVPAVAVPPPVSPPITISSPVPAPRGGGEPPVREPAQADLPHGSPCPSPNPSSAEPSGDSSGDESSPVAQLPDWMAPGEQVWVGKRRGTVHYVGGVEFAKGIWVGVKLDLALGESL